MQPPLRWHTWYALLLLAALCTTGSMEGSMCPGVFEIKGHGKVALTNTGWAEAGKDGSKAAPLGSGGVMPHMDDRAYFSEHCEEGFYDHRRYLALDLRQKTMRFTTNISGAGCGCNAALYLVSMQQNPEVSTCGDFYCDANKVCGINCAEIDIMEANRHSWHSTLHSAHDASGTAAGFGGGGKKWSGPRTFTEQQFGPGGSCIDTTKPFQVAVSFPADPQGLMTGMEVELSQEGQQCTLKMSLNDYPDMAKLSRAVEEGMTPVVSYWESKDMLWMDGTGADDEGPCKKDRMRCSDTVRFYDFTLEGAGVPSTTRGKQLPPVAPGARTTTAAPLGAGPIPPGRAGCVDNGVDCRTSRCCKTDGMRCYEKNHWWASCHESCQTLAGDPWTCTPLGPRTRSLPPGQAAPAGRAVPNTPPGHGEGPSELPGHGSAGGPSVALPLILSGVACMVLGLLGISWWWAYPHFMNGSCHKEAARCRTMVRPSRWKGPMEPAGNSAARGRFSFRPGVASPNEQAAYNPWLEEDAEVPRAALHKEANEASHSQGLLDCADEFRSFLGLCRCSSGSSRQAPPL